MVHMGIESVTSTRTYSQESRASQAESTTVFFREFAQDVVREELVNHLNDTGFEGKYDFAYMPFDFKRSVSLGYAVVNFRTAGDARIALHFFNCAQFRGRSLCVEWSESIQGLNSLIQRYRNSSVMHPMVSEAHKPTLFGPKGERVAFPSPTTNVGSMSIRHRAKK